MTCRALLEPTLDALWETQYEIWNLIKCFPEGLTSWKTVSVRENEYSEPYNIWSFNREPVPSDWVRFRYYSRRIRHIYLNHEYAYDPPVRPPSEARARSKEDSRDDDNDRTSRPSFEGYATLMKASRPLLPNVRSIHWRECPRFYETLEPFIPMFAGPHLLSLAISCPAKYDGDTSISSASDAMMEALHSLPSLSPSLQFLEFGFYLDRYVVSGISRVISRLRKLRVMAYRSASRLTFDEYVTLSSLPHLQRICGKLASETIPTYIRNNRNNSPLIFGALTSLELHDMATINDVQDIFASSKFPVLRKLVLDRDRRFPQSHEEHTSAILTQLQCCTTHHLLKEIEVDMKPRHYPRGLYLCPSAPIPDITIVSPLFAFHNLERVVISSEKTLCLCDNDVASFALAWPHLRELTLLEFMCEDDWDYKELGRHSRPTLVGLVLLAHKCQSLTKLFVTALPTLSCNSCAGSSALRGEYCDNVVSAETPTARRSSPKFPDSQKAERFDWDLSNFGPDQENDIPSITRSRAIYHEIEMHEQARGRDPPSWAAIRKHVRMLEERYGMPDTTPLDISSSALSTYTEGSSQRDCDNPTPVRKRKRKRKFSDDTARGDSATRAKRVRKTKLNKIMQHELPVGPMTRRHARSQGDKIDLSSDSIEPESRTSTGIGGHRILKWKRHGNGWVAVHSDEEGY